MKIQTMVPGVATRPIEPEAVSEPLPFVRRDIIEAIIELERRSYSLYAGAVRELLAIAEELKARAESGGFIDRTELMERARRLLNDDIA